MIVKLVNCVSYTHCFIVCKKRPKIHTKGLGIQYDVKLYLAGAPTVLHMCPFVYTSKIPLLHPTIFARCSLRHSHSLTCLTHPFIPVLNFHTPPRDSFRIPPYSPAIPSHTNCSRKLFRTRDPHFCISHLYPSFITSYTGSFTLYIII